MKITTAMVLAAGFGKRMRPLTEKIPKPLVPVCGKPMLASILDKLKESGFDKIVVNAFYLKDHIRGFLENRADPSLIYSEESCVLETGGGVLLALPKLGDKPFAVVNGDVCWIDGAEPALQRLTELWDGEKMDGLLLLHPTSQAIGYEGSGDFTMNSEGCLARRGESDHAPYVYAGIQILHPKLFKDAPDGAFSLNHVFDKALVDDRLCGLVHDGDWFHVGTPKGLKEVEEILQSRNSVPHSH
ncbi:nucleotidyltransferase family protein [Kiloniella antarctica]|uniref:Nucleotidyltransferase family protein n=1 Tax=Kiloniella antarctica TaxID=1550907 RepID=A0ABW5BHM4_9PROT